MLAMVRAGRARAFEDFDRSSAPPPATGSVPADRDAFMLTLMFVSAALLEDGAVRCRMPERNFLVTGPASSAEERGRTAGGCTANEVVGCDRLARIGP